MNEAERRKRTIEQYNKGMEQWSRGDYAAALAIGKALEQEKFSGCFEVQALALQGMGSFEEARSTLERGLAVAPNVWVLWKLLGDIHSDERNFSKAYQAYDRALACPDVDRDLIELNRAVVYSREKNYDEAIRILDTLEEPSMALRGRSYALQMLASQSKWHLLQERAEAFLHTLEDADEELQRELEFSARGLLALARFYHGDRVVALKEAAELLATGNFDPSAAWVLREDAQRKSPTAQRWSLVVQGTMPAPEQPTPDALHPEGFFRPFEVIADSAEEALEFVKSFFPEELRDGLSLKDANALERTPDLSKGVYSAAGYAWYGAQ